MATQDRAYSHQKRFLKEYYFQTLPLLYILIYNHPTGDSQTSVQDLKVLQIIEKGSEFIGVQLLDFMIIGDDKFWSLKENCKEKYEK
ncbi:JAB domain-containing protein [Patescibacteria group bacterium]